MRGGKLPRRKVLGLRFAIEVRSCRAGNVPSAEPAGSRSYPNNDDAEYIVPIADEPGADCGPDSTLTTANDFSTPGAAPTDRMRDGAARNPRRAP